MASDMHPLRKVPGCRNAIWDGTIGRWVIYRGLQAQPRRVIADIYHDHVDEKQVKVKHLKREAKNVNGSQRNKQSATSQALRLH